jgi:hypothetical protein
MAHHTPIFWLWRGTSEVHRTKLHQWVKNTIMYCPQRPVTKMCSSLITAFFYYLNLLWLAQHSAYYISCLRKTQLTTHFSPIWKSLMHPEHEHQDTYDETFFYRISISHNCHRESSMFKPKLQHWIYYCDNEPWESTVSGRSMWYNSTDVWISCYQQAV